MLPLALLLTGLIAVAVIAHYVRQWLFGDAPEVDGNDTDSGIAEQANEAGKDIPAPDAACRGCAVESEACYADKMLGEHALDIVYYDDEELDRYKGMPASAYTPEQTEEFREVLTTMRTDEITDWLHSLQLRGIELPDDLKDEAIMLMGGT